MKNYDLIVHKSFKAAPLDGKPVEKFLRSAANALEKANVRYWLSSGTLLGIHRDGAPMPDDTDIDISVMGVSAGVIEKIMRRARFTLVQSVDTKGLPQQRAFVKDGIILDIYFYYYRGDYLVNFNYFGWIRKPAEMFSRLRRIEYEGRQYKCPEPEEYLAWRYGDWKVPANGNIDTRRSRQWPS